MREIQLTQGKVALVDDCDYELVSKYTWHGHFKHGKWDACASINYSSMTMGRFLLGLAYGDKRRMEYINGDKLDNRRANIRIEQKNQIKRHDGIVEIDVGHGRIAIVNTKDYGLVKPYTWCAIKRQGSNTWYAQTNIKQDNGKYSTVQMHWLIVPSIPVGMVRDHKNRNGLDNRQENIRICTNQQNIRNQGHHRDAKHSVYKGVTRILGNRRKRPWVARIIVNYKPISLGYYGTELEAARAYDVGAKKYFGEYARLNFPEDTG